MTKQELMAYQQMYENMNKNYTMPAGANPITQNNVQMPSMPTGPVVQLPTPTTPTTPMQPAMKAPTMPMATPMEPAKKVPTMPMATPMEPAKRVPTMPMTTPMEPAKRVPTMPMATPMESAKKVPTMPMPTPPAPPTRIAMPITPTPVEPIKVPVEPEAEAEEAPKETEAPKFPPEWLSQILKPAEPAEPAEPEEEEEEEEEPAKPEPAPQWKPIKPDGECRGACLPYAYPPIAVKEPNESYACIIYSLFAGRVSELTAILRYYYDSSTFMEENKEAYEILKNIAMCEIHHMEILSKILVKLGALPKYHSCDKGQFTWWNAGPANMVYPTYLKMSILENLDLERKSIEAYNNAIKLIDDVNIITMLRRIVMDEEYHIKLLSELFNRCCA